MAVKFQVDGLAPVLKLLGQFRRGAANRILRAAITKASRLVRQIAASKVPVKTGALKKSLGVKIKTYRDGRTIGVIGPRTDVKGKPPKYRKLYRVPGSKKKVLRNPSMYAHLVEFGTKRSRPRPFMRPAYEAAKAQVASVVIRELKAGIAKELARQVRGRR